MKTAHRHFRPASLFRLPALVVPARLATRCGLVGLYAGLFAGLLAGSSPAMAGCVDLRGGEMLLSASAGCVAQMRQDPAVRQQVARHIGNQLGTGPLGVAQANSAGGRDTARGHQQGLSHPLARLSLLNAQSRYLWSLSNPAPTYYGQTQAR
ncbi:hypothetical protein AACH06_08435 [Ideonella sp. DXS29W]|uniref:Uncharacterized protein n=1 Tax=Ideonella lacteola TaxID=2984193 RepID=A0ABU9BLK4_9BURK